MTPQVVFNVIIGVVLFMTFIMAAVAVGRPVPMNGSGTAALDASPGALKLKDLVFTGGAVTTAKETCIASGGVVDGNGQCITSVWPPLY